MEYTLETANRLAEELRAIPAKDPSKQRLDKQALVKHLALEIVALQERGYTLAEIAESLRGHGLDIATPTLRNYLNRANGTDGEARKGRRSSGSPRTGPKAGQTTHASTGPAAFARPAKSRPKAPAASARAGSPTSSRPEPALRTGKEAFLINDKERY